MGSSPGWRSSRSSWRGAGDWRPPETEEECLEYYQDKIHNGQNRELIPLQEDLADWINKTLELEHLTATNLLDVLDNGVILCHLAKVIYDKSVEAAQQGLCAGTIPQIKGPFFEKASRRSFYSRDNMEKFISFCKKLGVHQNLLFETNDLVLQNQPRNVLLCLLEVARIASKFNVEPPGLVALEKEIAEEESRALSEWHFSSSPLSKNIKHSSSAHALSEKMVRNNNNNNNRMSYIQEGGCGVGETLRRAVSEGVQASGSDGAPSDTTEDEWSRASTDDPTEIDGHTDRTLNDLDLKVRQATKIVQKQCQCMGHRCEKLKVKKVGEGKYNIAGRNVLVRLLKGRHMMVRVGGGWDTLEHFLQRHDPCQARTVSRPSTPAAKTPRPYSALNSYDAHTPTHTSHTLTR